MKPGRFFILALILLPTSFADDTPPSRLLIIGLDGCRPDALQAAQTPCMDRLIANGTFITTTQVLGKRYQKNDTVSGPGWSSFLTGVWADKHGVHDNAFENSDYKNFPHLFKRIKQRYPKARTASFVDWKPIDDHIVEAADERVVFDAHGADGYTESDTLIARSAAQHLKTENPHVVMAYFGAIDETGHAFGFHPDVPEYMAAIETVDEKLQEVVSAMESRPQYAKENWLVVISTDHGGLDKGHGGGHDKPEIRNTFLVVSGNSAIQGTIQRPTYLVDLAATGLAHLQIRPDPSWQIDGQPVGLKPSAATGLRLSWKDRFLTVEGTDIPGDQIKTHYLEAYCRAGSTDQDWKDTVIPHSSRRLHQDPDGKYLVIEDRLTDGVVVTHRITAERDEVRFDVSAHNPTDTPSMVHWAQPCLRVDRFTGNDPQQARELIPPYARQCFIMVDGQITRLPTSPWATEARYTPGQVYVAKGIDRDDVNPRPQSEIVPSSGLCGCFSADNKYLLATAWEPFQEVFQGVANCMHSDFRIGGLQPGETKQIHGRLYLLPNNTEELLKRFAEDFPTGRKAQ